MFEDESTKHADVVFPAETHAEKEGTVTHPDGRLQRLRPDVPHPGERAPGLAGAGRARRPRSATRPGSTRRPRRSRRSPPRSPSTPGSPRGDRRHGRPLAGARRRHSAFPSDGPDGRARRAASRTGGRAATRAADGALRLGTYRDLWADEVTERNPALRFLAPEQTLELAPADAERLGLAHGDEVDVRSNGTSVEARVALRERMRPGARVPDRGHRERQRERARPAPRRSRSSRPEEASEPAARRGRLRRGDLDPGRQVARDLRSSSSRSSRC